MTAKYFEAGKGGFFANREWSFNGAPKRDYTSFRSEELGDLDIIVPFLIPGDTMINSFSVQATPHGDVADLDDVSANGPKLRKVFLRFGIVKGYTGTTGTPTLTSIAAPAEGPSIEVGIDVPVARTASTAVTTGYDGRWGLTGTGAVNAAQKLAAVVRGVTYDFCYFNTGKNGAAFGVQVIDAGYMTTSTSDDTISDRDTSNAKTLAPLNWKFAFDIGRTSG